MSPSTAFRPWPTVSGPVGFALTYSIRARFPCPVVDRPNASPASSNSRNSPTRYSVEKTKIDKSGTRHLHRGNPRSVQRTGKQMFRQFSGDTARSTAQILRQLHGRIRGQDRRARGFWVFRIPARNPAARHRNRPGPQPALLQDTLSLCAEISDPYQMICERQYT